MGELHRLRPDVPAQARGFGAPQRESETLSRALLSVTDIILQPSSECLLCAMSLLPATRFCAASAIGLRVETCHLRMNFHVQGGAGAARPPRSDPGQFGWMPGRVPLRRLGRHLSRRRLVRRSQTRGRQRDHRATLDRRSPGGATADAVAERRNRSVGPTACGRKGAVGPRTG